MTIINIYVPNSVQDIQGDLLIIFPIQKNTKIMRHDEAYLDIIMSKINMEAEFLFNGPVWVYFDKQFLEVCQSPSSDILVFDCSRLNSSKWFKFNVQWEPLVFTLVETDYYTLNMLRNIESRTKQLNLFYSIINNSEQQYCSYYEHSNSQVCKEYNAETQQMVSNIMTKVKQNIIKLMVQSMNPGYEWLVDKIWDITAGKLRCGLTACI